MLEVLGEFPSLTKGGECVRRTHCPGTFLLLKLPGLFRGIRCLEMTTGNYKW